MSWTANKNWSKAFARQALADLEAHGTLSASRSYRCHRLDFLQMAAEKMCKAHLFASGTGVGQVHAVIRKHLPAIVRKFGSERGLSGARLKALKKLGAEVEMLAPASRLDGSRPDNAEDPWQAANGDVIAPIDFPFDSIDDRRVTDLIKLIKTAASSYAS